MKFREIKFEKDINCPVCGEHPSIKQLIDYDDFCSNGLSQPKINDWEITVQELKKKMDKKEKFSLIDVREPFESVISSIGGKLIPMNSLPSRVNELNLDDEIIIYCRTGHRSNDAVKYLRKQGYKNVKNLLGGIYAWSDNIDSSVKKY